LFADTGVVVGSATLGPFAAEVLALPPIATTQPAGFPSADVVLALRHVGHLDGGRWHGVQQDALARLVVTTVLHDNPPPFLRDNSLARVLDRLFDATGGHSTADLLDGVRMSARTLERRCTETTGCTPAQLGRWFRRGRCTLRLQHHRLHATRAATGPRTGDRPPSALLTVLVHGSRGSRTRTVSRPDRSCFPRRTTSA